MPRKQQYFIKKSKGGKSVFDYGNPKQLFITAKYKFRGAKVYDTATFPLRIRRK